MAKSSIDDVMFYGVLVAGAVLTYRMGVQGTLGQTMQKWMLGVQAAVSPGSAAAGGGNDNSASQQQSGAGTSGSGSSGCDLTMTSTQYVGRAGSQYVVVINGSQVYSTPLQDLAQKVYNFLVCPSKYSDPRSYTPSGV